MSEYLLLQMATGRDKRISVALESSGQQELEKLRSGSPPYEGRFLRADDNELINIDQVVAVTIKTESRPGG